MSDDTPPRKRLGRRRRANVRGGRRHSHMVRVTPEEEALLAQLAEQQRVSVPRLMIETTLAATGETPVRRREAITELFAIRRHLAGVTTNVNQLARAANIDGRLPVGMAAALEDVRLVAGKIDATLDRFPA